MEEQRQKNETAICFCCGRIIPQPDEGLVLSLCDGYICPTCSLSRRLFTDAERRGFYGKAYRSIKGYGIQDIVEKYGGYYENNAKKRQVFSESKTYLDAVHVDFGHKWMIIQNGKLRDSGDPERFSEDIIHLDDVYMMEYLNAEFLDKAGNRRVTLQQQNIFGEYYLAVYSLTNRDSMLDMVIYPLEHEESRQDEFREMMAALRPCFPLELTALKRLLKTPEAAAVPPDLEETMWKYYMVFRAVETALHAADNKDILADQLKKKYTEEIQSPELREYIKRNLNLEGYLF